MFKNIGRALGTERAVAFNHTSTDTYYLITMLLTRTWNKYIKGFKF